MLHEKLKLDKIVSVAVAIVGVLVVAYGDGNNRDDSSEGASAASKNRVLGNIIIGVGSVLYGFYEVLYKKMACPPEGTSSGRSVIFANAVGSGIGTVTLVSFRLPSFSVALSSALWVVQGS